jgi:cytochrome P450
VLTREVELHGRVLSAGEKILLLSASGNRDERVFEDPERFDIERKLDLHLSFGFGVHRVGIRLGRLEMQIALRAFLDRIPEHELATDAVHWTHVFATRQLTSLPIAFEPSSRLGIAC